MSQNSRDSQLLLQGSKNAFTNNLHQEKKKKTEHQKNTKNNKTAWWLQTAHNDHDSVTFNLQAWYHLQMNSSHSQCYP